MTITDDESTYSVPSIRINSGGAASKKKVQDLIENKIANALIETNSIEANSSILVDAGSDGIEVKPQ